MTYKPVSFLPMTVSFCPPGAETPDNTWELVPYSGGFTCDANDCQMAARWSHEGHYFCVLCMLRLRDVLTKLQR